jgi:hypothetical protein
LSPFQPFSNISSKFWLSPGQDSYSNDRRKNEIEVSSFSIFGSPLLGLKGSTRTPRGQTKISIDIVSSPSIRPFESALKIDTPEFKQLDLIKEENENGYIKRDIKEPSKFEPEKMESLEEDSMSPKIKKRKYKKRNNECSVKSPKKKMRLHNEIQYTSPKKEEKRVYNKKDTEIFEDDEKAYCCTICGRIFGTGQAVGGHMSRSHPGKSESYATKKETRRKREFDRIKLAIAKIRYFDSINMDYQELIRTQQGKEKAKKLLCRSKVKNIKMKLTDNDVNNYVESNENKVFSKS